MRHRFPVVRGVIIALLYLHPPRFQLRFRSPILEDLDQLTRNSGGDSLDPKVRARIRRSALFLFKDTLFTLFRAWGDEARRGFSRMANSIRLTKPPGPLKGAMNDFRLAFRSLRRKPLSGLVIILTLAFGIGANTAIFSVTYGLFFERLPYDSLERVYRTQRPAVDLRGSEWIVSQAVLDHAAAENGALYLEDGRANLATPNGVISAHLTQVSPEFFSVLGAAPLLGTDLSDGRSNPNTVVLTHRLWSNLLESDSDVVGESIRLNGVSYSVVGVMPQGVEFPIGTDLWIPDPVISEFFGGAYGPRIIVRLRKGTTPEAMTETLTEIARAEYTDFGEVPPADLSNSLIPIRESLTRSVRTPAILLSVLAGMILLLACANLAGMALARLSARESELRLRDALGASRWQIIRLVLVENLTASLLAGILGAGIAIIGHQTLVAIIPTEILGRQNMDFGFAPILLTGILVALTGVLMGILPALHGARKSRQPRTQRTESSDDSRRRRFQEGLTVMQVSLSVVLVAGSVLLGRSLLELRNTLLGYELDDVVTFGLRLPEADFPTPDSRKLLRELVVNRIGEIPGVGPVGTVSRLPLADGFGAGLGLERANDSESPRITGSLRMGTSPGYFEAMGIPILVGTSFPADPVGEPTIVISKLLADSLFEETEPVGERVIIPQGFGDTEYLVLGVVGDVRQDGAKSQPRGTFYLGGFPSSHFSLATRVAPPIAPRVQAIRDALTEVAPSLPPVRFQTTREAIAEHLALERAVALVAAAFGGLALLISGIGVYGILAHGVTQRRKEIGIRIALGARIDALRRSVLGRALRLTGLGLFIGGTVSILGGRRLEEFLWQVRITDLTTLIGVSTIILLLAAVSAWIPAQQATQVDPVSTLKLE